MPPYDEEENISPFQLALDDALGLSTKTQEDLMRERGELESQYGQMIQTTPQEEAGGWASMVLPFLAGVAGGSMTKNGKGGFGLGLQAAGTANQLYWNNLAQDEAKREKLILDKMNFNQQSAIQQQSQFQQLTGKGLDQTAAVERDLSTGKVPGTAPWEQQNAADMALVNARLANDPQNKTTPEFRAAQAAFAGLPSTAPEADRNAAIQKMVLTAPNDLLSARSMEEGRRDRQQDIGMLGLNSKTLPVDVITSYKNLAATKPLVKEYISKLDKAYQSMGGDKYEKFTLGTIKSKLPADEFNSLMQLGNYVALNQAAALQGKQVNEMELKAVTDVFSGMTPFALGDLQDRIKKILRSAEIGVMSQVGSYRGQAQFERNARGQLQLFGIDPDISQMDLESGAFLDNKTIGDDTRKSLRDKFNERLKARGGGL